MVEQRSVSVGGLPFTFSQTCGVGTGYSWTVEFEDPSVGRCMKTQGRLPGRGVCGGNVNMTLDIHGLSPGTTMVRFYYGRSWIEDGKGDGVSKEIKLVVAPPSTEDAVEVALVATQARLEEARARMRELGTLMPLADGEGPSIPVEALYEAREELMRYTKEGGLLEEAENKGKIRAETQELRAAAAAVNDVAFELAAKLSALKEAKIEADKARAKEAGLVYEPPFMDHEVLHRDMIRHIQGATAEEQERQNAKDGLLRAQARVAKVQSSIDEFQQV